MQTYMQTLYIHINTYIHTNTQIHKYTHTHIHTYTQIPPNKHAPSECTCSRASAMHATCSVASNTGRPPKGPLGGLRLG